MRLNPSLVRPCGNRNIDRFSGRSCKVHDDLLKVELRIRLSNWRPPCLAHTVVNTVCQCVDTLDQSGFSTLYPNAAVVPKYTAAPLLHG